MARRTKKKTGFARANEPASASAAAGEANPTWPFWLRVGLIIIGALCAFGPALSGTWISDDNLYIAENPLLNEPGRLWKAWFEPGSFVEYYPLQQTAQWVMWQFFGEHSFGYHVCNLALHIISALLVWRLFYKLSLRLAWLGGLIFAVHPMMVESVAWISEFKNAFSLPPFLTALGYWVDFEKRRKDRDRQMAFIWFVVAMLCKITMAPFPFFILLYAWWKRGRIAWSDVKVALPFLAVSLVLSFATLEAGEIFTRFLPSPLEAPPVHGLLSRLALVGLTASFYFSRSILPLWPTAAYPQWVVDPPSAWQLLPWVGGAAAFFWFWQKRATWGRHALLGLGFFLLFLAPFLGFKNVSYMKCEWVYDHFLYIPIIGLIGLLVAALGDLAVRVTPAWRNGGVIILGVVVVAMGWQSHVYAMEWKDAETLSRYNLRMNPESWFEQNNLGYALSKRGDDAGAVEPLEAACRLNPIYALARYNLGDVFRKLGRRPEALAQLQEALRLNPTYADAHNNLGYMLFEDGDAQGAQQQFEEALEASPGHAAAHAGLGNVYQMQGQLAQAESEYRESLRLDPNAASTYDNLAMTLGKMGRFQESIEQFQAALAVDPQDQTALSFLQRIHNLQSTPPNP